MPIFSSQLGKVESQTPQEGIKTLAKHLRKIQEELEYRLMNLDSSNINEIDADITSILKGGKPFSNVVGDEVSGEFSILEQMIDSVKLSVQSNTGSIASLQATANGISSRVQKTEEGLEEYEQKLKKYSTTEQTAESIRTEVAEANEYTDNKLKKYSTTEQTAEAIKAEVKSVHETTDGKLSKYSTTEQTAERIAAAVKSVNETTDGKLESYSTTSQTASEIASAVSQANEFTTGKLESYSTITQTADNIKQAVNQSKEYTDEKTGVVTKSLQSYSKIEQTESMISTAVSQCKTYADGVGTSLNNKLKSYSTITQTESKIDTAVSRSQTYTDNKTDAITKQLDSYSTITQTAMDIRTAVSAATTYTDTKTGEITKALSNYSTIEQTATDISLAVQNLQTGMGTMLRLDENGVIVSNATGAKVTISNGNLNLTGAISFSQLSDGQTYKSKISNAEGLAERAYGLAESVQIPGYITSTHIDSAKILSPNILGGMFYATGQGSENEAAYYIHNGLTGETLGTRVGYLSYDTNGDTAAGDAKNRVLLTSLNNTALKLYAAANMSLGAGGNIYAMSPMVFSKNIILTRGVNYGTLRPATGTPGQLYFEIAQ